MGDADQHTCPGELQATLGRFKRRLQDALGERIRAILFGSFARGENEPDSDVDLLVVVPRCDAETMDLVLEIAWEVGFEAGLVLSVIPVGEDELPGLSESPFIRAVRQEGVAI
mgnify:CR=1 FL=1